MTNSLLVERTAFGASQQAAVHPTQATTPSWCLVPRCEIRVEKCKDGVKLHCCCEEEIACATLQNLCRTLAGGQCSLCCQWNGITVFDCKLVCGNCRIECTADGCCISCTSGDQACCAMIQSCCDALTACLEAGCCCYVCLNGTPVCCCC